jgi:hypothetical protein
MKQVEFSRSLEAVVQPAIDRSEQNYRDVDFDVVSGDGLIGMMESLQALPPHRAVTFLKVSHFCALLILMILVIHLISNLKVMKVKKDLFKTPKSVGGRFRMKMSPVVSC